MEFQYYGANCVRLMTKKASIVVDDNLSGLGLKSITKPDDISLFTNSELSEVRGRLRVDSPGEYEVSDISIQGIAARAHMDEPGQQTATIFKVIGDDVRVAVIGHIYPDLSDVQLEAIGTVDVLIVPVGGSGYTLDSVGALKIIKKIEPKVVIPTHYADKSINYPVPQLELSEALHELAMEPKETLPKLKFKTLEITDTTQLVVLERQ